MTDTNGPGPGAGAARSEPWTEYRQLRDNDRAREARGGPTREDTQADEYYRGKIGDPDRMRSLGADREDRNASTTIGDMRAALEERMDRRIATLREAGVSPDAIYVQARHEPGTPSRRGCASRCLRPPRQLTPAWSGRQRCESKASPKP
jgi:hypothetical protein